MFSHGQYLAGLLTGMFEQVASDLEVRSGLNATHAPPHSSSSFRSMQGKQQLIAAEESTAVDLDRPMMAELWSILLQHPSFTADVGVIAKLQSASYGVRCLIADLCHGQIMVRFAPAAHACVEPQLFASWLGAHASLAKQLTMDLSNHEITSSFEVALAAGILRHSMQLQSLSVQGCFLSGDSSGKLLLQGISSQGNDNSASRVGTAIQGLTYLNWPCWPSQIADVAALTGLQKLVLTSPCPDDTFLMAAAQQPGGADKLLLPLAELRQLRQLQLEFPIQPRQLHGLLAPKLEQLLLLGNVHRRQAVGRWPEQQLLQLGHLSSVTRLQLGCKALPVSSGTSSSAATLTEHDVMPENVKVLTLQRCCSIAALLSLGHLQQLRIGYVAGAAARDLIQLTQLTQLQAVELGHSDCGGSSSDDLAQAAAAWQLLPVKSLSISVLKLGRVSVILPDEVLQHLGGLQGLTALELSGAEPETTVLEASSGQLAAALLQLTALQRLQLHGQLYQQHQAQQRNWQPMQARHWQWQLPNPPPASSSCSSCSSRAQHMCPGRRAAAAVAGLFHNSGAATSSSERAGLDGGCATQCAVRMAGRHLGEVLCRLRQLEHLDVDLAHRSLEDEMLLSLRQMQTQLTCLQEHGSGGSVGNSAVVSSCCRTDVEAGGCNGSSMPDSNSVRSHQHRLVSKAGCYSGGAWAEGGRACSSSGRVTINGNSSSSHGTRSLYQRLWLTCKRLLG
jgi:hypothetical protein